MRRLKPVVIVDRSCPRVVSPIPRIIVSVLWSSLQLRLSDASPVTSEPGIIGQELPRKRIVFVSNSQEAAKTQDGVCNLPADLVDHDAFNRADLLVVCAING